MREAHNWTGQLLAAKMFVDQSRISRLERGDMTPRPDQLRQLSDLFGVSIDALVNVEVEALRTAANRARQLVDYDAALDKATRAVARWMIIRADTPDAPDTPADVLVRGALEAMRLEDERIAKNASAGHIGQPRRVPYNVDEFGLNAPPRSHPEDTDGWQTTMEGVLPAREDDEDPTDPENNTATWQLSSGF